MPARIILLIAILVFVFVAQNCRGDLQSEKKQFFVPDDYHGRGSEACQAWQYSMCLLLYQQCDVSDDTRTVCKEKYGSMVCRSDEEAFECAEELQAADYCSWLSIYSCGHETIADSKAALYGCNELNNVQCEYLVACGQEATLNGCIAELYKTRSCVDAVGLSDAYEQCLETIKTLPCNEPIPSICDHVIVECSKGGALCI